MLIRARMGGLTGILVATPPVRTVTKLVLVDVVPRFEKSGSARIRDFMFNGVDGFDSLEQAADAVAAYLPHRPKPRSPEGLKKNLRLRDGRWYWHWDPAFLTKPEDDPFVRMDMLEQAAINLEVPILLIRGKLSDVVSAEGVRDFLPRCRARSSSSCPRPVIPRRATTTTRSARSSSSSSTAEPANVGFNFLAEPELPAPQVTEAQAERLLATHYGLTARAKSLGSNQDKNFLVFDGEADHPIGVLKIANPAFTATELAAQDAAAEVIARSEPTLRVAVPLPNTAGEVSTVVTDLLDGTAHVRLLRYLAGGTLVGAGYLAPEVVARMGELAARISRALADFRHPGLDRALQWDLRYGHDVVAALAPHVADPTQRDRLTAAADTSWLRIAPLVDQLPCQAVHLDLTDANIVAGQFEGAVPRPDGVIDFGDLSDSWAVSELAITLSSVLGHPGATPTSILSGVKAFHAVRPLSDAEVDALWPLLVLRTAVLIVSGAQQVVLDPDNQYLTDQSADELRMFEQATSVPGDVMTAAIRAALGRSETAAPVRGLLIPGLDVPLVRTLDLSAVSDVFDTDPEGIGAEAFSDDLARSALAAGASLVVTRFGEPDLTRAPMLSQDSPDVVATGLSLWPAQPVPLLAPWPGDIGCAEGSLTLRGGEYELTVSGTATEGLVDAGAVIATVPADAWTTVSVRLAGAPVAPLFTTAELAPGWRALTRDPRPLLGLPELPDIAARDLLSRRDESFARVQEHYYSDPPQIERGRRHYLMSTAGRVLPRHGQQRRRARACPSADRRRRHPAAAQAQHQLALQLRGGRRVQRAPGRHAARPA